VGDVDLRALTHERAVWLPHQREHRGILVELRFVLADQLAPVMPARPKSAGGMYAARLLPPHPFGEAGKTPRRCDWDIRDTRACASEIRADERSIASTAIVERFGTDLADLARHHPFAAERVQQLVHAEQCRGVRLAADQHEAIAHSRRKSLTRDRFLVRVGAELHRQLPQNDRGRLHLLRIIREHDFERRAAGHQPQVLAQLAHREGAGFGFRIDDERTLRCVGLAQLIVREQRTRDVNARDGLRLTNEFNRRSGRGMRECNCTGDDVMAVCRMLSGTGGPPVSSSSKRKHGRAARATSWDALRRHQQLARVLGDVRRDGQQHHGARKFAQAPDAAVLTFRDTYFEEVAALLDRTDGLAVAVVDRAAGFGRITADNLRALGTKKYPLRRPTRIGETAALTSAVRAAPEGKSSSVASRPSLTTSL
jgi:hypothetical protein